MGFRYVAVATALKLFSTCSQVKWVYRHIANLVGSRQRMVSCPETYLNRAWQLQELVKRNSLIRDGDKILELGTGWIHWDSIVIRLLYDVSITLFDVCDNRQLAPIRRLLAEVPLERVGKGTGATKSSYEITYGLRKAISSVRSFDELYGLLGFEYVIDKTGTLRRFGDESFDVVFSIDVLEHVRRDCLTEYLQDVSRVLKSGGYSFHNIDMTDHLHLHDRNVSAKNYLVYSDRIWKLYFENDVQYFNRVQRTEWLDLFRNVGLQLMEQRSRRVNIKSLEVDRRYRNLDTQDLECRELTLVYRKPVAR